MSSPQTEPGASPTGLLDRYLGPDATTLDRLRVALAAGGGALLGLLTVPAPPLERLLLALLSAELCAGLMAALNHSGKAWIHRPEARWPRFALHLVWQSLVIAGFVWLFRDQDVVLLLDACGLLVVGALAVALAPAAAQRGVGLVALLGVMFLLQQRHGLPAAGAWFLPLCYARTFLAHLPQPRLESS